MNKHSPTKHLNPNVKRIGVSATVAINARSDELRRNGKEIFKLGLGESPFPVHPLVVESLRRAADEKSYLPVRGLDELREAVAEHHRREFGIDRDAEDVLIGPGSKELMFLLQLVYHGDLVIPSPSWVSYAPQAEIVGRGVHWAETTFDQRWLVQADALEALCFEDETAARLMILNYPSNPTGQTYSRAQLDSIADVARRHEVLLLSDEIYGKLHHEGAHTSVVPLYSEGTIFSGGLSKWCGAGGWRLGVFVFPPDLRWLLDAMASVASETFTSTSSPIQHAAVTAFQENPEIDRYLYHQRIILKSLGRELARKLASTGATLHRPEGGFYLFPSFANSKERLQERGIETDRQLCKRLLEDTGVAILPGSDFGRGETELTARLAYVDFDGAQALAGARELGEDVPIDTRFLQQYCGRMLEAIERLGNWLESAA